MSETWQAYNWTTTTMRADTQLMAAATGGVWQAYAPVTTVPPFVIVQQQSSIDVNTVNGVRLFTDKLMQMKAVGLSGSFDTLQVIADRIDALFKSVRDVALASGGVLACYREQEISMSEIINGASWSHLGALYRIQLQGS